MVIESTNMANTLNVTQPTADKYIQNSVLVGNINNIIRKLRKFEYVFAIYNFTCERYCFEKQYVDQTKYFKWIKGLSIEQELINRFNSCSDHIWVKTIPFPDWFNLLEHGIKIESGVLISGVLNRDKWAEVLLKMTAAIFSTMNHENNQREDTTSDSKWLTYYEDILKFVDNLIEQ